MPHPLSWAWPPLSPQAPLDPITPSAPVFLRTFPNTCCPGENGEPADPRRHPGNGLHGVPPPLGASSTTLAFLLPDRDSSGQERTDLQQSIPRTANVGPHLCPQPSSKAGPSAAGNLWTGLRQGCEAEEAPGGKAGQTQLTSWDFLMWRRGLGS